MSALTRVLRNSSWTVSHTFTVGETATDPTGTPTYAVVDANGTSVQSGNVTVVGGSTGRVTFTLASQAAMKRGTVTYAGTVSGNTVTEVDHFEVVSDFYFTLAQARASDTSLSDTTKYPTADLELKRAEVEVECENICDRAFFPRYDREVLDGTGRSQIILRHSDDYRSVSDIRTIRRVSVAPDMDETFVDYTAAELAGVSWSTDGVLTRTDGNIFTEGRRNVIVEWEYGLDRPPPDLIPHTLTRLRSRLNLNKTGIPDRASSFTVAEGGTFRLDMPGAYKTGIPDVDAAYSRYSRRSGTGPNARKVPASRTLAYSPQRYSLFHGR